MTRLLLAEGSVIKVYASVNNAQHHSLASVGLGQSLGDSRSLAVYLLYIGSLSSLLVHALVHLVGLYIAELLNLF